MYKEEISYPKGTKLENVCFYAGLAAIVLLTSVLSGYLARIGLKHMDFLAFGVFALLALLLVYQRIFHYRYQIIGEDMIVTRLYGEHEKNLLTLHLWQISSIGEYEKTSKLPSVRACVWSTKLRRKQVIYSQGDGQARLVFQPSDLLCQKIADYLQEKNKAGGRA